MTTPAEPRGAGPARDRSPARAARRRRLRTVLTVVVALCAAVVAGVAGVRLVRSAGSNQPASHAAAGSSAAKSALSGSSGAPRQATGGKAAATPTLSPAQLAGQRVIYSYRGLTPPAAGCCAGSGAARPPGSSSSAATSPARPSSPGPSPHCDRANASPRQPVARQPLLLMTDQEGGAVRRLPGAARACRRDRSARRSIPPRPRRTRAGAPRPNLRSVGLNVNLAPVLDVYRTAGRLRSTSSAAPTARTRTSVSPSSGADFIKAQQAAGVAATAKHFPGLGAADAAQNTDERPVTLDLPRSALRGADEFPYRAAIRAGVKLVMAVMGGLPGAGPECPAGLSVQRSCR